MVCVCLNPPTSFSTSWNLSHKHHIFFFFSSPFSDENSLLNFSLKLSGICVLRKSFLPAFLSRLCGNNMNGEMNGFAKRECQESLQLSLPAAALSQNSHTWRQTRRLHDEQPHCSLEISRCRIGKKALEVLINSQFFWTTKKKTKIIYCSIDACVNQIITVIYFVASTSTLSTKLITAPHTFSCWPPLSIDRTEVSLKSLKY